MAVVYFAGGVSSSSVQVVPGPGPEALGSSRQPQSGEAVLCSARVLELAHTLLSVSLVDCRWAFVLSVSEQ